MDYNIFTDEQHNDLYCVYKHINIFNGKVYIGITCQDPKVRWSSGHGYRKNKYFWRSIQKYGWNEGFSHEVLYEDLTYEEACQKEIDLISMYNSTNPTYGYNRHPGGKCNDYDVRRKISENNTQKKITLQYSKEGDFIAEYESRLAASRATGIGVQEISFACNGTIFSAGGFFWCDKDNLDKIQSDLDRYRSNMEHILQFDLCGNLLHNYRHVCDASEQTGIDRYEIWSVCFDELKPLNGFLFCYEGKEFKIKSWIKKRDALKNIDSKTAEEKQNKIKKRSAGPKRKKMH